MPVQPIATVGSMHLCPLCSGIVPHVGGPVIGPGIPGVTINGQPIAVMGDMCACAGSPDTIAQGCPGVTVNGKPVAIVGSMTAHGGQIIQGVPGVTIESPSSPVTMAVNKISFPDINFLDDLGAAMKGKGKSQKQGKENIEKLKEESQKDNLQLSNLQWLKDGQPVDKAIVGDLVQITADVTGINEGESVHFQIFENNRNCKNQYTDGVCGWMKDNKIIIDWIIPYIDKSDENPDNKQYLYPQYLFKGTSANTCETSSNELKIMGWIKTKLVMDANGEILANTRYTLHYPDGKEETGTTDNEGYFFIPEMEVGNYSISINFNED